MFAVIYRAYLHPATEAVYQQQWHKVAHYFVTHCGALGSCLHKTEEGYWLAYSRWPNKAARDRSWPGENAPADSLPDDISKAIIEIQQCINQERKIPEICMEIIDDFLIKN
jgi:hypothetical protein